MITVNWVERYLLSKPINSWPLKRTTKLMRFQTTFTEMYRNNASHTFYLQQASNIIHIIHTYTHIHIDICTYM